jgi:hypothetical protein
VGAEVGIVAAIVGWYVRRVVMSTDKVLLEIDRFESDIVTERLPVSELWEDGIEPADDFPLDRD